MMTRPLIGMAVGICAFGAIATNALSHGEADWIGRGGYVSPTTNVACCNVGKDCQRLDPAAVRVTGAGYAVIYSDFTVLIPFKEAQVSKDKDYWRCASESAPQHTRCFFAPLVGA